MEDKQIIELYWERSDEAIKETKEKYGQHCSYIANNILQNEGEVELCLKEIYERVWDTIPPRRPQNFKAYLCKITRNHALHRRYQELDGQVTDLFTAELIIQDFLKELEPKQRKLFVAHYWYFAFVSEIALQNKMSENKVNETLVSLRQKLDDTLGQKGIQLQNEAELFYAMTEMDDRYLEEAEPQMAVAPKVVSEEKDEKQNQNSKQAFSKYWKKYQIPILACSLCLILVVLIWPKHPVEQNPTESESESETGSQLQETESQLSETEDTEIIDLENLISISMAPTMAKEDFEEWIDNLPWDKEWEVIALPLYKNLAYHAPTGQKVYLDADTLTAMAEKIVLNLNMEVESLNVSKKTVGEEEYVYRVSVKTDLGYIYIEGDGSIDVIYTNGVKLSNGDIMSDKETTVEANETVSFLLEQYSEVLSSTDLIPNSYIYYDGFGNRKVKYRAVGGSMDSVSIVDYYAKQVEFYYDEQKGMTRFRYMDKFLASELIGYYPIICYDEAKEYLLQGHYITDIMFGMPEDSQKAKIPEEKDIRAVELLYNISIIDSSVNQLYYQPYYCFYVQLSDENWYSKCYVPAMKGAGLDGSIPETENVIMDLTGYDKIDNFLYKQKDKWFTVGNGRIEELVDYEYASKDYIDEFGEITFDYNTDYGKTAYFYHKELKEKLNLTQLFMGYSSINARNISGAKYIDGKVVIYFHEYGDIHDRMPYVTCFVYSEDGKLNNTPIYKLKEGSREPQKPVEGLLFNGGRYATYGDFGNVGNLMIFDIVDGSRADTVVPCADVKELFEASDDHYAVLYKSGEIEVIEKETGKLVKRTKERISFTPSDIAYKDGVLYAEVYRAEKLLFVIDDFE